MKYVTNHLSENPTGWWVGTDFVEIQAEDVGKVLGIVEDSNGNPAWGVVAGGSLPDVTGSDDGKVLGVISGEWAKMDSPYREFLIRVTPTSLDLSSLSVDTPAATIVDAIEAGKKCKVELTVLDGAKVIFDAGTIACFFRGANTYDLFTSVFRYGSADGYMYIQLDKPNNLWTASATFFAI